MSPKAERPGAGDFTGREKAAQAKTERTAQAGRRAETTMATAVIDEEEQNGVFDPKSNARLDDISDHEAIIVDDEPSVPGFMSFPGDDEPTLSGKESDEEVAPLIAVKKAGPGPRHEVVHSAFVTIRVDADIEDMTYGIVNGQPNNFNFKEGLKYRVPRELAEHLNERGLVRQWVTT